jgi:hypothetical protein
MAGTQITTSVTIINSLLGFQAITLTNLDGSAATVIAAGSKIEIASGFFTFASNETPQTSTWTAITTGNTAYITLTPSGTAGSQSITAKWSDTVPEWSSTKQGWYLTTGSVIRYIGGCYKNGGTSYQRKFTLSDQYNDNDILDTKVVAALGLQKRRQPEYLFGSVTSGTVWDRVTPSIPNNDDIMSIAGAIITGGSTTYHATMIRRVTASTLNVWSFTDDNSAMSTATYLITASGGVNLVVSLRW